MSQNKLQAATNRTANIDIKQKREQNLAEGLLVEEWLGGRSHSWSSRWFDGIVSSIYLLIAGRLAAAQQRADRAISLARTQLERAYALRLSAECSLAAGDALIAFAVAQRAFELEPHDRWVKQTMSRALASCGHDDLAARIDETIPELSASAQHKVRPEVSRHVPSKCGAGCGGRFQNGGADHEEAERTRQG